MVSMADFKAVYYGTRTLLHHGDPYREADLLHLFLTEDQEPRAKQLVVSDVVAYDVNLPTTFPFVVPFAIMPWGPAHLLWMLLTAGGFVLAAFLAWDLAAAFAPQLSGGLLCLFLFGGELLLEVGNTAGLVVGLCVLAVWCFLRQRFAPLGVLCLAIALLVKPHDAGFVWLYFLLAGGLCRKRALQTLLLAAALGLPAILWVSHVAPNWIEELHANMLFTSAHGGINDPGPASLQPMAHGSIIVSLQSVLSVFRDDPRFYNPAAWLLCAPLLLLWAYLSWRNRSSPANRWLGLAAIAALSMLPLYHRQHDTGLLLLTVPACVLLWSEGGPVAWLALAVTALGAVFTSNLTLQFLAVSTAGLRASVGGLPGQMLTVLLCRPAPLILLAMGIFYLAVYARGLSPEGAEIISTTRASSGRP